MRRHGEREGAGERAFHGASAREAGGEGARQRHGERDDADDHDRREHEKEEHSANARRLDEGNLVVGEPMLVEEHPEERVEDEEADRESGRPAER